MFFDAFENGYDVRRVGNSPDLQHKVSSGIISLGSRLQRALSLIAGIQAFPQLPLLPTKGARAKGDVTHHCRRRATSAQAIFLHKRI
jgi:hypothetical protein